jgi:YVTN family beta-propeller protein
MVLAFSGTVCWGQTINSSNWGTVTSPVYGTTEQFPYGTAELFAGPNKFGSYYSGVLPNGAIVKPAGTSAQIGMNPLGVAITSDGKYVLTSNDDEREGGFPSYQSSVNVGGYSLSVIDTSLMRVVSQITTGNFFIGLQVTGKGPYTVWASGGPENNVKTYTVSTGGQITAGTKIAIAPILPNNAGYVSNYTPDPALNKPGSTGNLPPIPTNFSRTAGAQTTFPAGSALSPDGRFLYVACNGDNSVAVIDTTSMKVVNQVGVGYFPYGVAVNAAGTQVAVTNWGITEYKFAKPSYGTDGKLTSIGTTSANLPDGFYVPVTNTAINAKTSSVTMLSAGNADGTKLAATGALYMGKKLDDLYQVGDTHPSATAIVKSGNLEVLYVTKSNSDSIGLIRLDTNTALSDFNLAPVSLTLADGHAVHGAYPNALAVSPDNTRVYVAEAGINSVAVLDTTDPTNPKLLGRIGTGWYPTGVAVSPDGKSLYVANAKGIGEDINPNIIPTSSFPPASGVTSDPNTDSNYIFGSLQKIDLTSLTLDNTTVLGNNFAVHASVDTSVVPVGGSGSSKINTVIFILKENKTFDSVLTDSAGHFGPFASSTFNNQNGSTYTNRQYLGVTVNLQQFARRFATAVNYYSDSEESDAGHQFAASGTATDYTEKTLLVKGGRGLLVNKNFDPEDYPEGGYIFNNAARNGVSFKEYGVMIRITGTDTGTSVPSTLNDSKSGLLGYPQLNQDNLTITNPLVNGGDVTSPVSGGLGQSYFLAMPSLAVLGKKNPNGEARIDLNYPGYNFNISDQRRAQEFIADFDRMLKGGTLPQFIYLYLPNDHTGGVQAPNAKTVGSSALQQVADNDVALGMVLTHIMNSQVYYNAGTGQGAAIFITQDDAQSSLDHIHPHRTPLVVVSPYAKPGYLAGRHYVTASVVKTEELLLGLPPNNLGDLFATDLRDMFQPNYNGIRPDMVPVNKIAKYTPSKEGKRIWALVNELDIAAGPDRDSHRLGALTRLSLAADDLHFSTNSFARMFSAGYRERQNELMQAAVKLVVSPHRVDDDD